MTVEALDLGDILFFFLDDVSISTYCKKVVATTFLTLSALRISLVVLIFLASLALVDRKLLVFVTRCVSGRSVSRLSLSGVFLLLFLKLVPLETP